MDGIGGILKSLSTVMSSQEERSLSITLKSLPSTLVNHQVYQLPVYVEQRDN